MRNRDETAALLQGAQWAWLAVAVPVCLIGMSCVGLPWRAILSTLGEQRRIGETLRWYFPGQLGKYVPGGIWPVLGRSELAARAGVRRAVAYTSVALSLACTYLAATLTSLGFLMVSLIAGDRTGAGVWALLLLPAGLVLLHPRVLTRLVATAERLLSRQFPVQVPEYRTILRLILLHVPAWVMIGVGTWMVAKAFTPAPPFAQIMFAGVLSWVVGFVVVPVPGGIGVREAAFVAAAVTLAPDVAAATAIVSRLCFIAADLLGAGIVVSLAAITGTRRTSPSGPPDAHPSGS